jgi:hypothetical protein
MEKELRTNKQEIVTNLHNTDKQSVLSGEYDQTII